MPRRYLKHDLRTLTRVSSAGLITLPEVARALELPARQATLRMARIVSQGWARRVRRGVYLLIDVKTPGPEAARVPGPDELAQALFAPCYVGGWSAARYWGIGGANRIAKFVVTAARVRHTNVNTEGFRFHLVHVPRERIEAPGIVNLEYRRSRISDQARTIVDALCDPSWIGGAIRLANAYERYWKSELWDEYYFAEVMQAVGTGAAYKRLGAIGKEKDATAGRAYRDGFVRRTAGVIDLDPAKPTVRPVRSVWGVRLNVDLNDQYTLPPDGEEEYEEEEELDLPEDFIEGVDDYDDP